MKFLFSLLICFLTLNLNAQDDVQKLLETARTFTRQGDYTNAILVLNRAAALKPGDLGIEKDIAYNQYLAGNLDQAAVLAKQLLEREDADVQAYQIAGNIFKGMNNNKECLKLYKKGIKKFPNSGALHFEYGEVLLIDEQRQEAIDQWETGIDTDPSYSGNYYHAAKFYAFNKYNIIRTILYGEIFVNLESYSVRTAEMKDYLLKSYKEFYVSAPEPDSKKANAFETAVATTLRKQSDQLSRGVNTESLTIIRTRFLLDWFEHSAEKYPYRLFEQQQYLVREGLFEAYNQWLFGQVNDIVQYQQWASNNPKKVADFTHYQKNRVFRMPPGQNYK
jgi:tetratricopeptide (TPR) repeat protein